MQIRAQPTFLHVVVTKLSMDSCFSCVTLSVLPLIEWAIIYMCFTLFFHVQDPDLVSYNLCKVFDKCIISHEKGDVSFTFGYTSKYREPFQTSFASFPKSWSKHNQKKKKK